MMQRKEIPPGLQSTSFRVRDGLRAGLSADRLRGRDLERPFHGVRTDGEVRGHADLCVAFSVRMSSVAAFTGPSAAVLLGLPLPRRLLHGSTVHVGVPDPLTPPRGRNVRGTRIRGDLWASMVVDGVRVTSPWTTWVVLARWLTTDELTIVADALLAESKQYPGRHPDAVASDAASFREFAAGLRGVVGAGSLRTAGDRARAGVESPMETVLRLALVDAAFPEPEVGGAIPLPNGRTWHGDLVYRGPRVVVEYEGAVHRQEQRFDDDIERVRTMESAGWTVIRVTARHLRAGRFASVCDALRHALASPRDRSTSTAFRDSSGLLGRPDPPTGPAIPPTRVATEGAGQGRGKGDARAGAGGRRGGRQGEQQRGGTDELPR